MERRLLICATHGALYHPDTGRCAGGPCRGGTLVPLAVVEEDDVVRLQADGVRLVTY
jgi:nitrite reductase/ring-hydroxylating ferredoxin subunit